MTDQCTQPRMFCDHCGKPNMVYAVAFAQMFSGVVQLRLCRYSRETGDHPAPHCFDLVTEGTEGLGLRKQGIQ